MIKKILLVFCILNSILSQAQWTLNFQTQTNESIKAMSAPSDNVCWFATNLDNLYKTQNRGVTWTKLLPSNISFNPYGLFVMDSNVAFKTSNGNAYKTSDGGVTWHQVFTGTTAQPPVIFMKDLTTGILAFNGLLYKTSDGGETWSTTTITQPPFPIINSSGKGTLDVKGDTIWAALSNKGVATSTDFGVTWNLPTNTGLSFTSYGNISFANASLGVAVRHNSSYVYVTTDGANSWTMSTNSLGANEDVLAFNNELWFIPNAFDHFYVKHSTDLGVTWTQQLFDGAGFDVLEKSRDGGTLWVGSDHGAVYLYDTLLSTNSVDTQDKVTIAPNPFKNETQISFSDFQDNTKIKIFNLLGKEINTLAFSGTAVTIEKGVMSSGIYFVQITDKSNKVSTKKLVVE